MFICVKPARTHTAPPYILYSIRVYSILINTGKGEKGGELNQRKGLKGGGVENQYDLLVFICIVS